ncbi:MAG: alpha/beta hydrolase [Polyangiaceae bacterium]|nr:alpha/beta hydrolase [Polyangiaceae bacterium]
MLAHSLVTAPGATPARWALFLHGILGQGNNWRGFARRLVEARPAWGAVLIDLRAHGRSLDAPPPDSGREAARDLSRVPAARAADVVVGHSLGGKVALHLLDERDGAISHAVIVDSNPGARPGGRGSEATRDIVEQLRASRGPFPDRASFVAAFTSRGHARPVAEWLAMNLEARDGGWWLRVDPERIHALLVDHLATDLWHVVERPPGRARLTMVVGGASSVFDDADRERLRDACARSDGRSREVTIEGAGHWVHVDAPDALTSIVLGAIDDAGT